MKSTGGSRFGWSWLSSASDCPTKWYFKNLAPWPGAVIEVDPIKRVLKLAPTIETDSITTPTTLPIGIESKYFSPALDTGSRFHYGVEALYLSKLATGKFNLDEGLAACRKDYPDEPSLPESEALEVAETLLRKYAAFYKDDPDIEVYKFADGTPGVEAELWVDLGHKGYMFTSRLDLIYRRAGYLNAMEHKTTAASSLGKLISRFNIDGQVTGQFLQLASHFTDEPIGGVTLNAAVKDRGAKSELPSFSRRDYSRTPAQLEKFKLDIIHKLSIIDGWVEQWMELVSKGMSFDDAALVVFDGTPNGMQCVGMGFACEFLGLCEKREVASRLLLDKYRPREYRDEWSNPLRSRVENNSSKVLDDPKGSK